MSERSRKIKLGLCIALLAGAACGRADGATIQRLSYETGNFLQWTSVQALSGQAAIVRAPVRQGRFAARFTLRPDNGPLPVASERVEVFAVTGEGEGSNSWWAWSTYFPRGFRPNPGIWNVFTQWHHSGVVCSPPVNFLVDGTARPARLLLSVRGGVLDPVSCGAAFDRRWQIGTLRRGRWYDFRFHVQWSSDPAKGLVSLWINGRHVLRKAGIPTLYPGQGVYVKQGFYRNKSSLSTVIYHDGLRRFRP
jgi:hypothetical protein